MSRIKLLLLILTNVFIFICLVSGVLTGNNWNDPQIKIVFCCSLGLNILFAEYTII